ncbi:MAG: RNA polymerase sigma factor [Vulcanimicrobiaceae bacterium]
MSADHLRLQTFDEAAIRAYRGTMLARARSIVKNEADAQDVVQEALERAWRSRERFIAGANPRPWLLKITTNLAIDFLQRQLPIDGELPGPQSESKDAPERSALLRETARSIEAAVQDLTPAYRTTFVLHDIHGYSSREISSREQLPYHTVRTHLFRARQQLRRALAGVAS